MLPAQHPIHERLLDTIRHEAEATGLDVQWSVVDEAGQNATDAEVLAAARQAGVDQDTLTRATARALGLDWADHLGDRHVSAEFVNKVPIHFARQYALVGLEADNGTMPVAISDPTSFEPLDVLARFLGPPVRRLRPLVVPAAQIHAAINQAYQQRNDQASDFIEKLDPGDLPGREQIRSREDLLDIATRAPVIKLVSLLLFEAVKAGASDLHVQPYEDRVVVRMRIDGVLFDSFDLPKTMQDEVISRVKVMGKMNIAEKRLPQDGRATVEVGDRLVDLRIASLPTHHGERIVVRLLDKSARLYTLDELGMSSGCLATFSELIKVEHGLILVTGPTGSGKSTTLYAALQQLNSTALNVVTLEDPIEYQLPGVSQTQVNEKKGLTFARGLRNVLRQDPDIIMVGEIRDHETAVMAIQSALTGHLVFSTLHTNDAASAVTRLLDLEIEPYLVASSVIGVLAQRLVRRVCPSCTAPAPLGVEALSRLEVPVPEDGSFELCVGRGCDACRQTGYSGRLGLFELLLVNDEIRRHIQARDPAAHIKQVAVNHGMKTLREDGVGRVLSGQSTVEEVVRVTTRSTV